jgi:hypothetical protein
MEKITMQIKPDTGQSIVYFISNFAIAINASNQFFSGIVSAICSVLLFCLLIYFRLPKTIVLNDKGVIFEFYAGKSVTLDFDKIHRINKKGLFKWRIIFKAGGFSEILNYSFLSKKAKQIIYDNYVYHIQSINNINK